MKATDARARVPGHAPASGVADLRRRAARNAIAVQLAVAALCVAGVAPARATGTLIQKPGAAGCVAESFRPCAPGRALGGVNSIVISPDGRNAYAASQATYAVVVFDRAADGTLTQKGGTAGCIAAPDAGFGLPPGSCATGTGLRGADTVAISPDGRNVYAGSYLGDAVAVFDRKPGGTLTQKTGLAGCISDTGAGPCADGTGLRYVSSVSISPDGTSVYAAGSNSDAIAVFDRAADGTLTQKPGVAGCISESGRGPCIDGVALVHVSALAISPDGRSIYATSSGDGSVAVFDRRSDGTLSQKAGVAGCISDTTNGGACAFGKALRGAGAVSVSPDGASVYVPAGRSSAVAVFDRRSDGALTQKAGSAGCVSSLESGGACTTVRQLTGATSATVSPDGTSVYVATLHLEVDVIIGRPAGLLAIFDRAADGTLTQPAGAAGCVSETGSGGECSDGTAVDGAASVSFSPNGGNAYAVAFAISAVAVFDRTASVAPPPPADVTRPLLRGLALTPARLRASARGEAIVARGGSKVSYRLSEPAQVSFTVQVVVAGRRTGVRCLAVRRSNRSRRRCDRYRTLAGRFTHVGAQGRNVFRFSGRLRSRRLPAGRYRLSAVARDAAGNRSGATVARFAIRRG
jgi:DNA-binding beta-propeller fold protein YncE